MAADNKSGGRTSLINSVKTPLGFFTLVVLILDAVLIGTSALTSKIQMWAPLVLLGLVVVLVFVIVIWKPLSLYDPKDWPQRREAKLVFPGLEAPPDFDVSKCTLTRRDIDGREKPKVIPNLTLDQGAWVFPLPADVEDTDSVLVELFDKGNGKWKAGPFQPFETIVETKQTS